MKKTISALSALAMAIAGITSIAHANQINTGGTKGAYHGTFCAPLQKVLKKSQFDYSCATSAGSRENIQRVTGDPSQIGFAQYDVFALESKMLGDDHHFAMIRDDIARECLFMVTKNKEFTNFGEISAYAKHLRFILPPQKSGSAATFEYLQQIDPEGLGRASDIENAASTDEAALPLFCGGRMNRLCAFKTSSLPEGLSPGKKKWRFKLKKTISALSALAMAIAGITSIAHANQINTGGTKGAYHGTFCAPLQKVLKKSQFDYSCATSAGSRENIQRVTGDPSQIGFAQYDVFALESKMLGDDHHFAMIRDDIARECLFMVTKNKEFTNFGEISAYAKHLRFILPPQKSGSAATFEYLQQIDPEGLGRASDIENAASTDEAIQKALSADDTVTLFVQFPDPDNARFKRIKKLDGHFIPVIDRRILRQTAGGKKVYYAEETEITNPKAAKNSGPVVTACTPMVVFTGSPSRMERAGAKQDHKDLIATLKAIKQEELRPSQGFFKTLWKKTKALSATSVDKLMDMSEKAREAAGPMMERAKEKAHEAMDKAKPMLERAKEKAHEVMDKAQPYVERAKEKAKELGHRAKEEAEEMMDKAKEKLQ